MNQGKKQEQTMGITEEAVTALLEGVKIELRKEFDEREKLLQLQLSTLEHTNDKLLKLQRDNILDAVKGWINSIDTRISTNTQLYGELNSVVESIKAIAKQPKPVETPKISDNWDEPDLENRVTQVEGYIRKIDEELTLYEQQLDNIEDQSRRNNIKFYGIPERSSWETWEQSEAIVREIMDTKLRLPNVAQTQITRAHRLGRKSNDQNADPRPIIVKYDFFRDRQAVLRASGKLKEDPVSLSEDFCQRTSDFRKNTLRPKMLAARSQGKYAVMRHRRLIIRDSKPMPDNNVLNDKQIDLVSEPEINNEQTDLVSEPVLKDVVNVDEANMDEEA